MSPNRRYAMHSSSRFGRAGVGADETEAMSRYHPARRQRVDPHLVGVVEVGFDAVLREKADHASHGIDEPSVLVAVVLQCVSDQIKNPPARSNMISTLVDRRRRSRTYGVCRERAERSLRR